VVLFVCCLIGTDKSNENPNHKIGLPILPLFPIQRIGGDRKKVTKKPEKQQQTNRQTKVPLKAEMSVCAYAQKQENKTK